MDVPILGSGPFYGFGALYSPIVEFALTLISWKRFVNLVQCLCDNKLSIRDLAAALSFVSIATFLQRGTAGRHVAKLIGMAL